MPWCRWRACAAVPHRLLEMRSQLKNWRIKMQVVVLLVPYLRKSETTSLRSLWLAWCMSTASAGLHVHGGYHLPASLFSILFSGEYKGCQLQLLTPPLTGESVVVHPACQCAVRPRNAAPWLHSRIVPSATWPLWKSTLPLLPYVAPPAVAASRSHSSPTPPEMSALVRCTEPRVNPVSVPWWVSRTTYAQVRLVEDGRTGAFPLPRWQTYTPSQHLCSHRTMSVPATTRAALKGIDDGIIQMQNALADMAVQVRDYSVGRVGVPEHLRTLMIDVSVAFWLLDVVSQPEPTAEHTEALRRVYREIQPDLMRRPWPPEGFDMTPRTRCWPNPDGRSIAKLYANWWRNIYDAAIKPESAFSVVWKRVCGLSLRPLTVSRRVLHLCRSIIPAFRNREYNLSRTEIILNISSLVSAFLSLPTAVTDFTVLPTSVCRLQCSSGKVPSSFMAAVGDYVRIRKGPLRNRLCVVVGVRKEWDQCSITASLEFDARFAKNCYHLASIFCLARRLGSTSQPAEQWAHEAKVLYDPTTAHSAHTIAQRLRHRHAGVRGDGTDKELLKVIAAEMYGGSRDQFPNPRQAPRDTKGRALENWQARRAKDACGRRGDNLLEGKTESLPIASAPMAHTRFKNAKRERAERFVHTLEEPDNALLMRYHARGSISVPWFASTRRQWEDDMALTARDERSTKRARTFFKQTYAKGRKPRPVEESALVSPSASSSDGSSDSSAVADGEASPSLGSGASPTPQPNLDCLPLHLPWVLPKGGQLHCAIEMTTLEIYKALRAITIIVILSRTCLPIVNNR